jgi:hypothetical protein
MAYFKESTQKFTLHGNAPLQSCFRLGTLARQGHGYRIGYIEYGIEQILGP